MSAFADSALFSLVGGAMGKLNVALLRYLSREDFRVLTAVSDTTTAPVIPRSRYEVLNI